jgi:Protein of unknown function (DUF1553)/Protein of unknown function (DUF1549)/Concanavalin A-like lectin/glucanases superfamily/Planctomycete cytochrome C
MIRVSLSVICMLVLAPGTRGQDKIRFNRDIRPILADNCFPCHGPDSAARKAKLRLDDRDVAVQREAITPGHSDKSEMIARIFSEDSKVVMPPAKLKKPLSAAQKERLRQWIQQGAVYERHWSFQAIPRTTAVPKIDKNAAWVRNPIDAFVLDRLQREKLEPAVEATREAWLRRVTFDLTGLPPTLAEIDAFLADKGDDAYADVVQRLFRSPAYGERMANDWLDVARYADTFGYQNDRLMHMWPWRDWVIQAFQKNLSYDKFILWQTAGDMLPDATQEQKRATAFNRLHRQTNEGGSIAEEFRVENVADRLRTNGLAFLGLTLECARCHDHKFDPISTKDYYRLSAFFNNIDEFGLYSHFTETAPSPAMLLYEKNQEAEHRELLKSIRAKEDEWQAYVRKQRPKLPPPQQEISVPKPVTYVNFDNVKTGGDNRLVPGKFGQALEFGGDDAYTLPDAGDFGRTQPFTIALWLRPAELQARAVVLHRSRAAEDSAFRGYSLVLDQGHLVVSLVHFWPGNALQIRAKAVIPPNAWTHAAFTYDGSSKAKGLQLYVNGKRVDVEVVRDRLSRDIRHRAAWGDADGSSMPLSLGARFRDVGFRKGRVDELKIFDRDLSAVEVAKVADTDVPTDEASRFEHGWHHDAKSVSLLQELRKRRDSENDFANKIPQIMVMQEMKERRPTYVLFRGAYDAPREKVEPDVPPTILPFPETLPRNRLGFAQWLVDGRNPLTARVAVNRIWQMFFQRGLVVTAEDFGSQGAPPVHPELLDWLARHFIDSGWNVQELCQLIALSSTYRQSSRPRDTATLTRDPDNALLARGPRGRLPAEMIRDNALAISGLLVAKIGGPSVFPYQPKGLWEESGTNQTYRQSKGEGLYRRSLYTFWRRTSPPPTMTTFDAPSREGCLARRERTTTPLQALVLLNDPQFVEAARVLSEKLLDQRDLADRLTTAFRLATSRQPAAKELELLTRMFHEQKLSFEKRPQFADALLKIGERPRNAKLPAADHAALTVVIQAIMNLDDCVTKK